MAGKAKHAKNMEKHLGEPVDSACPISHPGGTTAKIAGNVGGAVGAAISSVGGASVRDSDVPIGRFGWLGLSGDHFTLTNASAMGKPTGDPLARVGYAEVAACGLTQGKLTTRVDLDLTDGRHVAFEIQKSGTGKPSIEVVDQLAARCGGPPA